MSKHIIVVGQTFAASRTVQRANAMQQLGFDVTTIATTPSGSDYETPATVFDRIAYRLRIGRDKADTNGRILNVPSRADVLWLDNANLVRAATLQAFKAKNPYAVIVWYSEDDMMNPRQRTRTLEQCIPHIDLWVTTKSFNAEPDEVPSLGVRQVVFVNNAYDPDIHRPLEVDKKISARLGADVCFVGTYEAPRAQSLVALAKAGVKVRVWGNGWSRLQGAHGNLMIEARPIYNDDYVKAICASAINLCFLRRGNRDKQTCRSVEIPACGGFMLHERNDEIEALFRAGREAAYFSGDTELIEQCHFWHDKLEQTQRIGHDAHLRVDTLRLSHKSVLASLFDKIDTIKGPLLL